MIPAVGLELCRLVGNGILAAQFLLDGAEGASNVAHLKREECTPSGRRGQLFQSIITAHDDAAIVCADGVDHDLSALRHLNGVRQALLALIVLTIAYHDQRAANRLSVAALQEFFPAGQVDSIVESGAAAVMQPVDRLGEVHNVVRVVLHQDGVTVKADYECFVSPRPQHLVQKLNCRVLLETHAGADRTTGINHQADT